MSVTAGGQRGLNSVRYFRELRLQLKRKVTAEERVGEFYGYGRNCILKYDASGSTFSLSGFFLPGTLVKDQLISDFSLF